MQADGSKRLLSGYRDASWSPHGLYLAAIAGSELRGLEPNGRVHWSLARPGGLATPRWSYKGYRVVYLAGDALRVVNGDGTGDHLLAAYALPVAPAWQNGTHVLAFVDRSHRIHVVNVDTGTVAGNWRVGDVTGLAWSNDGQLLAVGEGRSLVVYRPDGTQVVGIASGSGGSLAGHDSFISMAFSPRGHTLAFAAFDPTHNETRIAAVQLRASEVERTIFNGAGRISDIAWSPVGRWLVLNWQSANQLLFIRSTHVRGLRAVANVEAAFGTGASFLRAPMLEGWCCP